MKMCVLRAGLWAVWLAMAWPVAAAPAEVIELADLKPLCRDPFDFDPTSGSCKVNSIKLGQRQSEAQCQVPGLKWTGTACTAPTDLAKDVPAPECGNRLPDLAYNAKTKECHVVRDTPRSAMGDYVGDCFKIIAVPSPNTLPFAVGEHIEVQSQRALTGDDKELTVSVSKRATLLGFTDMTYGCGQNTGPLTTIRASKLAEVGAHRYGYTYGVLTLPFKYYPGDKSILAGGLAIGPYFGRRWGQPGSAVTFAVAATLGSVKGEVRDAADKVTSTPDLTAFSVAAGLMWDVSKNPNTKAFKIGLFYGKDRVSSNDTVKFKQNGKPWVAFQIGYDFTDN